jgi:tRNA(fMet)-specific endonuclease VapC
VSYLLDTNICSYHLRRPSGLVHRFIQHCGRLFIPSIVLGELYVWVYRRDDPRPGIAVLDQFVRQEVRVLPFEDRCAETFGRVRATLLRTGLVVNRVDLMIAATALVHDLTLVTNNTADFRAVPDLRLDDWLPST